MIRFAILSLYSGLMHSKTVLQLGELIVIIAAWPSESMQIVLFLYFHFRLDSRISTEAFTDNLCWLHHISTLFFAKLVGFKMRSDGRSRSSTLLEDVVLEFWKFSIKWRNYFVNLWFWKYAGYENPACNYCKIKNKISLGKIKWIRYANEHDMRTRYRIEKVQFLHSKIKGLRWNNALFSSWETCYRSFEWELEGT